ncbi:MAG: Holliday junction branch migration protein RuvA [Bifidobacteriaceae bacterium]|jgi:Holliday junction DNA helicase RuvA|nr:Holliday junction branch migration protein RuvA [Bifidobacteriaceae bacterium]
MISYVKGKVISKSLQNISLLPDGTGIALQIQMPAQTIAKADRGATFETWTSLIVRQESLTLYGFETEEEVSAFETLLSISGIGARTALTILSIYAPHELDQAIQSSDLNALTKIPGIGKKSAQRVLVELQDKRLSTGESASQSTLFDASSATSKTQGIADKNVGDVIDALVQLGWNQKTASDVVNTLIKTEFAGKLTETQVPDALRLSLRAFAKPS